MKDAYYFSHDSNAKDDPKIGLLIDDLGLEGYGAYWVLIECLRDQPNYKYHLSYLKTISRKYNITEIKLKQVLTGYELFVINEEGFFYSMSLIYRMEILEEKRKKRSNAGKKGNETRWGTKSQCDKIAIADGNQSDRKLSLSKVNNIKVNNIKENKKKLLQCNENLLLCNDEVTNCNTEKEKENISSSKDEVINSFEEIWSLYPNKKGKTSISLTNKKELYKIDIELLKEAINLYKKDSDLKSNGGFKPYQGGDRFFKKTIFELIELVKQKEEVKNNKPKFEIVSVEM